MENIEGLLRHKRRGDIYVAARYVYGSMYVSSTHVSTLQLRETGWKASDG